MERSLTGFMLIAVGGFVGAVTRYGIDVAAADGTGVGTFTVNVVGSFGLGVLVTRAASRRIQLLVGTGALSSFTTYSTFVGDAVALGTVAGSAYVVASYAVGIAAAVVGLAVGRRL
ncbi:CrcB family protein [Halorubrum sp. JWXQ-INN 858]|uniref:fluoride efflux transporter FluC n=1 Tax=Halorubrum sp. JWXQ-INN 858 TaxID=2690782 RepID=UPI0013568E79|nr:CrcB family protein [Halorubrum sp. JWXQ-INN 858]MWV65886.1 CrcB family protein [Halorubrum sp. JWXQ-INN 858]